MCVLYKLSCVFCMLCTCSACYRMSFMLQNSLRLLIAILQETAIVRPLFKFQKLKRL